VQYRGVWSTVQYRGGGTVHCWLMGVTSAMQTELTGPTMTGPMPCQACRPQLQWGTVLGNACSSCPTLPLQVHLVCCGRSRGHSILMSLYHQGVSAVCSCVCCCR
jgi:hypothetical protein